MSVKSAAAVTVRMDEGQWRCVRDFARDQGVSITALFIQLVSIFDRMPPEMRRTVLEGAHRIDAERRARKGPGGGEVRTM